MCRLDELESVYKYQGAQTCAADGMCQVKCPVKINTGEMIKHLRAEKYDDSKPSEYAAVRPLARRLSKPWWRGRAACAWAHRGVACLSRHQLQQLSGPRIYP